MTPGVPDARSPLEAAGQLGPLAERLMTIRTLRSGGHPWTADELCAKLRDLGLDEVREVERESPLPVRLYAATKA